MWIGPMKKQSQNKPKQSQSPGSASSCADLFEGAAIGPDVTAFSFDLSARPVILKCEHSAASSTDEKRTNWTIQGKKGNISCLLTVALF